MKSLFVAHNVGDGITNKQQTRKVWRKFGGQAKKVLSARPVATATWRQSVRHFEKGALKLCTVYSFVFNDFVILLLRIIQITWHGGDIQEAHKDERVPVPAAFRLVMLYLFCSPNHSQGLIPCPIAVCLPTQIMMKQNAVNADPLCPIMPIPCRIWDFSFCCLLVQPHPPQQGRSTSDPISALPRRPLHLPLPRMLWCSVSLCIVINWKSCWLVLDQSCKPISMDRDGLWRYGPNLRYSCVISPPYRSCQLLLPITTDTGSSYSCFETFFCFNDNMIWCFVGKADYHCLLWYCGRGEGGKEGDNESEDEETHGCLVRECLYGFLCVECDDVV